jgi:hypothetical protein
MALGALKIFAIVPLQNSARPSGLSEPGLHIFYDRRLADAWLARSATAPYSQRRPLSGAGPQKRHSPSHCMLLSVLRIAAMSD